MSVLTPAALRYARADAETAFGITPCAWQVLEKIGVDQSPNLLIKHSQRFLHSDPVPVDGSRGRDPFVSPYSNTSFVSRGQSAALWAVCSECVTFLYPWRCTQRLWQRAHEIRKLKQGACTPRFEGENLWGWGFSQLGATTAGVSVLTQIPGAWRRDEMAQPPVIGTRLHPPGLLCSADARTAAAGVRAQGAQSFVWAPERGSAVGAWPRAALLCRRRTRQQHTGTSRVISRAFCAYCWVRRSLILRQQSACASRVSSAGVRLRAFELVCLLWALHAERLGMTAGGLRY